jgi:hypothetical protein
MNWFTRQKDLGYKTDALKEQSKSVSSMDDIIELFSQYYLKQIDLYYALCVMEIINPFDTEITSTTPDGEINRELLTGWARELHKFNDDEVDILKI